jgi:hypothetical protein
MIRYDIKDIRQHPNRGDPSNNKTTTPACRCSLVTASTVRCSGRLPVASRSTALGFVVESRVPSRSIPLVLHHLILFYPMSDLPNGSCRHLDCGSDRTRAVSYTEYLLVLRSLKGALRSDRAVADRILKRSVQTKLRIHS